MPTYEYACASCSHEWEEIQKISEPPVEVCPQCGKKTAKRQISGGSFILKGGGWYADLYASPKPGSADKKSESNSPAAGASGKSEGSTSAASSASGDKGGGKSESSPPAKPPTTPPKS
jgi:putative FmdB family regulatory protein